MYLHSLFFYKMGHSWLIFKCSILILPMIGFELQTSGVCQLSHNHCPYLFNDTHNENITISGKYRWGFHTTLFHWSIRFKAQFHLLHISLWQTDCSHSILLQIMLIRRSTENSLATLSSAFPTHHSNDVTNNSVWPNLEIFKSSRHHNYF